MQDCSCSVDEVVIDSHDESGSSRLPVEPFLAGHPVMAVLLTLLPHEPRPWATHLIHSSITSLDSSISTPPRSSTHHHCPPLLISQRGSSTPYRLVTGGARIDHARDRRTGPRPVTPLPLLSPCPPTLHLFIPTRTTSRQRPPANTFVHQTTLASAPTSTSAAER